MARPSIYSIDERFFSNPSTWTEKQAYWLGWLYSDGSIGNKSISIKIQERDKSALEQLRRLVGYDGPLTFLRRAPSAVMRQPAKQHQHRWCLTIYTKELKSQLATLGIDKDKRIAPLLKHMKPKLYRHFIRGLWEGDGTFCFTRWNKFETNLLADENMLEWVADNLDKVGLASSIVETGFSNGVKKIRLCGNNKGIKLFNYLYSGCRYSLARKTRAFIELYRYKNKQDSKRKCDRKGIASFGKDIKKFL